MKDYVIYIDTDSNYIEIDSFCEEHLGKEWWSSKTDDQKIDIILELSTYIKDYINKKTYEEVQQITYNSAVEDFKINFEMEKIAESGIFIAKKGYAVRALWVDGEKKEKISVTGLSVVRSDSSEAIRVKLKDIIDMILRNKPDKEISDTIEKYKKELKSVYVEEIAANIGVKNLKKYIKNGKYIKGTPWHVKGVCNYMTLLEELGLKGRYEEISEGNKCKVLYLKPNSYGMETISFLRWPKELNDILQPDYKTMIDKFFINKIKMLLEPIGKIDLLNKSSKKVLGLFFK